jgi:glycosyltransferase involved in cell wall biosynthesis
MTDARKKIKQFIQNASNPKGEAKTALSKHSEKLDSGFDKLAKQWQISQPSPGWLADQLQALSTNRLIWIVNDDSSKTTQFSSFRPALPKLFEILRNPAQAWRVVCPLLEPAPIGAHPSDSVGVSLPRARLPQRPFVLKYLHRAAQGDELEGVLYLPEHLRRQLIHWDQQPNDNTSLLSWFARLKPPFRKLVSPHPLFDPAHYNAQLEGLPEDASSTTQHPIVDYLIGCTRKARFRALEPSGQFNPCLWKLLHSSTSSLDIPADPLALQAPLVLYLAAMRTATTSCPIPNQKLAGMVDGLDEQGIIRGWCKPITPGEHTRLAVWLGGLRLGIGVADQPRSDVARRGVAMRDCGFAIQLDFEQLPLDLLHNLSGARWLIATADQEYSLGRGDWRLNGQDRSQVALHLVKRFLQASDRIGLSKGLAALADPMATPGLRYQILDWCAISAAAGNWDLEPLLGAQDAVLATPALQQGMEAESCCRAELLLLALGHLQQEWDIEHRLSGCNQNGQALADQLAERCHFGPTARERQCWDSQLRPLFNVVIATLLLQHSPPDFSLTRPLLESLIRLCQEVFWDLQLARTLDALLNDGDQTRDAATLRLLLRSGDFLGVAIALFHQRRSGLTPALKPFDQTLARLEISKYSLVTIKAALQELLPLIPEQQGRTPRTSHCRRILDQLGWQVNTLASTQIDQLIASGIHQPLGLGVHERSITILSQISQALWAGDNGRSGCAPLPRSSKPPLRWLLIGEKALPQCWLYRVEQKRQQLERCGAEVRCIEKGDLDAWSFSQQILWADAVIFCRIPATYGVIRALSFARHCGKQLLADVDDLVFSSDFPAPYITYGGSISRELHRRLGLDRPLQLWPLEQADAVLTSTTALADACRQTSDALANKPITVLPNLPLPELLGLARRLEHRSAGRPQRLVVSSGTLAHKQIWAEQLAPAIAQLLEAHAKLSLSLIGHLELPTCLQPFSTRIRAVPYSDYSHYLQQLSEATIALVPLESRPTTHSKSAIKWMEASLLGLASVCSPVRAYTDAATPEEHLLLAGDQQAWVNQVERLLHNPALRDQLATQAKQHAHATFSTHLGEQIWSELFLTPSATSPSRPTPQREKLLVINVFFAPQSFGGATRVAQDHVRELVTNHPDAYDVTVLCIDHDPWQDLTGDTMPLDMWNWHGARIVRLAVPPRPWADIQDSRVETFCREWFQDESFDLIHCHCTQVLTASPLVVAKQLGIPYLITLHDAWWISPELFLVSPAGRLIDPAKPFDHIDGIPTAEEKAVALERRSILTAILQGANKRLAVSEPFRQVYKQAGVEAMGVRENQATTMQPTQPRTARGPDEPIRICHVGGMAMHKGYHILRQAVHLLRGNLNLEFIVIDHRLQEDDPPYTSSWNNYPVRFMPPVSMIEMADFYSRQDILVAPSIWPESFGLVTREAISAGLFVIASDVGALAVPIESGINGTRISPDNPQCLMKAIDDIWTARTIRDSQTQFRT